MLLPAAQACHRAAYRYQPPAAATAATGTPPGAAETKPQLLFLSFNMSTEPGGAHKVTTLGMKVVPGQLNAIAEEEAPGPSYLLISQLDGAGKPCGPARRLPHPLVQDVEAPANPATGALTRQLVTVAQAEFFVRLARQPQAKAVRLEEVGPAAPKPVSVTFPLSN